MKRILFAVILFSTVVIPSAFAHGDPPFLDELREEVVEQLTIATNNPTPDKKLVSSLRKALTTIDKTKPDVASGAKALGVLAKNLNRTAISNEFAGPFQEVVDDYVDAFLEAEDVLSDRLAAAFPSKSKTSAEQALLRLLASLQGAITNDNIALVAKFLSTAAKDLVSAVKFTVKAEDAPAPDSHLTATITGSGEGTVNFSPSPVGAVAVRIGDNVQIIGTQIQINGTTVRNRVLTLNIPNIVDGTTTYGVSNSGAANVIYTTSLASPGDPPSGDIFNATGGTITVTINIATKTATGTFTFSAPGANVPGNVATSSNGSFSVVWQ